MSPHLQQLENNEAILLMYLAGELSAEDRAEIEQMLEQDAGLRGALAELSAVNDQISGMLSSLDGPVADSRREAAVRRVSRALVQAKADQIAYAAPTTRNARRLLNLRRFLWPAVAAAILVGGILLWPKAIQMPAPQVPQYAEEPFPDVLAFERKPESDPLTNIEQELLSLGKSSSGLEVDWNLTEEQ